MVKCAVINCKNYSGKKSLKDPLRFYVFPKDLKVQKLWINACGENVNINPKNARMCSEHFTESDFSVKDLLLKTAAHKRRLKEGVVPSINVNTSARSPARKRKEKRSILKEFVNEALASYEGIKVEEIEDDPDAVTSSRNSFAESVNDARDSSQSTLTGQTDEKYIPPKKRSRGTSLCRCMLSAENIELPSCTPTRTVNLHQALAKMIAVTQIPLSFVSHPGFADFMEVAVPGYQVCQEEALKTRLKNLQSCVKEAIVQDLCNATHISCTANCWTTLTQDSYLTVRCHTINSQWAAKSYTLSTKMMEKRHTAENLTAALEEVFENWDIDRKVLSIVTNNDANIINAVRRSTAIEGLTCAAYSLQLAADEVLKHPLAANICAIASKVVAYFKCSSAASQALEKEQNNLFKKTQKLVQSAGTHWSSTFEMLDCLCANKIPVVNVLMDRRVTSASTAIGLEISDADWDSIENLINVLKPLQMATTLLCEDKISLASMVRPLIHNLVNNHMKPKESDSMLVKEIKNIVASQCEKQFKLLTWDKFSDVSARLTASFLDPRYKDLEDELPETRRKVHKRVFDLLREENPSSSPSDEDASDNMHTSALAFLFNKPIHSIPKDIEKQLEVYTTEPQLSLAMDPLDWWRSRQDKFPAVASLARQWLSIPATSATSERTFSAAGNFVTPKCNYLEPENVDMLVFLYQNKQYIPPKIQ